MEMASLKDLQVAQEEGLTEVLAEKLISRCSMVLDVIAQITGEALDAVHRVACEVERLEEEEKTCKGK